MANMSYCRFQNTLEDLKDCFSNMNDGPPSYEEATARHRLIKLCSVVAEDYLDETEEPMPTRAQFESGTW